MSHTYHKHGDFVVRLIAANKAGQSVVTAEIIVKGLSIISQNRLSGWIVYVGETADISCWGNMLHKFKRWNMRMLIKKYPPKKQTKRKYCLQKLTKLSP